MLRGKILVIGAGRSTLHLHEYLAKHLSSEWAITIADRDLSLAESMVFAPGVNAIALDVQNYDELARILPGNKLVISMLPADLHLLVIERCVELGIHVATASYLTDQILAFDERARQAGVTILNELGLDPGLDHLSAMHMIDRVRREGGLITHFESFTGGLVAPECDDNPWGYKFTWNPRNVVISGQGGAVKFIQEGQYKFIPYHRLFRRTEIIEIEGYGKFEGYANRDSLKYRSTYGLDDVRTMYRGTLRRPGFCKAWDCFVQLGATDDSYELPGLEEMTHRDFINTFLAYNPTDSVELKLRQYLKIDQDDVELWDRLVYLGIFEQTPIGLKSGSPARVLQHILEKKWALSVKDRDMIVMWHKLLFKDSPGVMRELNASLVVTGEDRQRTAMSKTVGLPLALGSKLLLEGSITRRGCIRPVYPEIYEPLLDQLKELGIHFVETLRIDN
ncbi:MAG: saccharopine dehydrogenase NADP-binding domain-containing protein [Flavobacteriales bacterium]|nr:saccharopine dehydrogenase NADP-binding domain-containing protein [Flavobacteriales bacterium]